MASRDKHLDHLASVPLFSGCTRKELQKIAKASNEISVETGRVLTDQGDAGREAFVIATLGPGDAVGELSLLDHGPRTATVEATTPMTLLVLTAREFSGVVDEVPGLAHKLMSALASRIRELDGKVYG